MRALRVAVIAEYYPRPGHPGWGVWAHRQALAARDEGADVRVLALERPIPPLHALRALGPGGGGPDTAPLREWLAGLRAQPRSADLDGLPVRYVRFVSPPRPLSYASWGRWAARPVGRALDALQRSWPIDVVHAHYAVPAGDAALRWMRRRGVGLPLVVSVHGGDLSYTAPRSEEGRATVAATLRSAACVLANSELTREGVQKVAGPLGGLRVVHPGADVPGAADGRHGDPTLVTVAHLEQHKAQADVIRALSTLRQRHPRLRYLLIGKGPDREELARLAHSLGVAERVVFKGALSHQRALAELARCHVHVMPSHHDAFGVAHIEAMAAGLPTIGGTGTGAEDIARAGEGMVLVRPADVNGLVRALDGLIGDPVRCAELGEAARRTVAEKFSWERCGAETVAAYAAVAKSG